jgi:hypothetical protein
MALKSTSEQQKNGSGKKQVAYAKPLYDKLLKTYKTQKDVIEALKDQEDPKKGISRATVQRVAKGIWVSAAVYDVFRRAVEGLEPPSFWRLSEEMNTVRKAMVESFRAGKLHAKWCIDAIAILLEKWVDDPTPSSETVFALWLMGLISTHRAEVFREQEPVNRRQAELYYENALAVLEKIKPDIRKDDYDDMCDRLVVNIFIVKFNGMDPATRSRDPKVKAELEEKQILQRLKRIARKSDYYPAPHFDVLWASCIAQNAEECDKAGAALVKVDPRVLDPYDPLDARPNSSLATDHDLWFGRERPWYIALEKNHRELLGNEQPAKRQPAKRQQAPASGGPLQPNI